MKYYKITLNSVPKFLFCCAVTVNNYKNSFHKKPNFLEIAITLEGDVVVKNKDNSCVVKRPPALNVHTCLSDYDLFAYENQTQSHITVGVEADYSICETDEQTARAHLSDEENVVFLPDMLRLDWQECDALVRRIRKIAFYRNSSASGSKKKAIGEWFDLCSDIETLRPLEDGGLSPSAALYAKKIRAFVSEHICEKITVAETAEKTGLSVGYAQNVFKKATGESIIEYVNRRKIETAVEMLRANKLKLKELAHILGVDDPAYFSRLFKKVTGVSYAAFCREKN